MESPKQYEHFDSNGTWNHWYHWYHTCNYIYNIPIYKKRNESEILPLAIKAVSCQ